jgi:hypothetical protein
MRRSPLPIILFCLAASACAGDLAFAPDFTAEDLDHLAGVVADAVTFPNVGSAEAGGLTGFSVLAVIGGSKVDTGQGWWRRGTSGGTTAGFLTAERVALRKGLPAHLDVGGQVGRVLGARFWGAELRWTLLGGGMISPAFGFRASYSRLAGAPLDLQVGEVQAVLSKGFALLTPYAAVGYREIGADARFGTPRPSRLTLHHGRPTAAAGVVLSLLPLRLVGELRQGAGTGVFLGLGVGL